MPRKINAIMSIHRGLVTPRDFAVQQFGTSAVSYAFEWYSYIGGDIDGQTKHDRPLWVPKIAWFVLSPAPCRHNFQRLHICATVHDAKRG